MTLAEPAEAAYYPDFLSSFRALVDGLKGERVAVVGHIRPDGDCIGSQVAMTRMLRAEGVDAVAVNGDTVPRILKAFLGDTPFHEKGDYDLTGHKVVTVDSADPKRIGKDLQERVPEYAGNIDHHISNPNYAGTNFIDVTSAATGEILAGLFLDAGLPIDPLTAQALYIGIATDTGQFRFSSTTPRVFEIAQKLIACGANPAAAALELYENESMAKLQLLQRFLASFELKFSGRVCIGTLRACDFTESGATKEDTEGLVDYARAIDGVEIGVLVEESDGKIKGSFRAKDPVHRVDQLASNFNGGGHACAAGFNCDGDAESFKGRLIAVLEDHFDATA